MKKRCLSVLISALLTPMLVSAAAAQTADQVVERHLAAVGGRAALEKLTSRASVGTVTIATPNGDLSGPLELYAKAPNKTRAYMVLDLAAMGVDQKMEIDQKFDGAAGWALNSLQGNSPITGNQLENMKNNAFPTALLTYKTSGAALDLLPGETLAGRAVLVLRLTPKTGSVTKLYLDAETYLIVRTSATITAPDGSGDIDVIAEAADYRTVDGIKVPFKTVQSTPTQTVTFVLTSVAHNVAIDDAMFTVK